MNHEVVINKLTWKMIGPEHHIPVENLPERYKVSMFAYKYSGNDHKYWEQLEFHVYKDGKRIVTFCRNHPTIVNCVYAKQNGKEFIITSGDYMCVTIVNLTDGTVESYTDESRYGDGLAYCPSSFGWDENENTLNIIGCIWGSAGDDLITFTNIDLLNPVIDYSKADIEYLDSVDDDCDEEDDDDDEYYDD